MDVGGPPELLPLDAGEQFRFRFAMDACVGCHSCEVACAEQNATPVDVAWRRVGELEGGSFPGTRRFHLSMACNHCLEPTCLSGCPTNAYTKLANGIVAHDAGECIGCQYCIWNCPYEVPVFDRSRKIVSKCDMCRPRLEAGQDPACVNACPTQAIAVEKVDVAAWRKSHAEADAPGLPPADITMSTTRVVLPAGMPAGTVAVSDHRVEPEDPHWPLIFLTLLTQLSLGAVAATVATQLFGGAASGSLSASALGALLAGFGALGASVLHLGRPHHALKALRNLRTSWLSREVLLFSVFSAATLGYVATWRGGRPAAAGVALGLAAVLAGTAGVYASARIYLVPARPAWNSPRTVVAFFATALSTGPLFALLMVNRAGMDPTWAGWLIATSMVGVVVQLGALMHLLVTSRRRADRQHQGTSRLLTDRFGGLLAGRLTAGIVGLGLLASVFDVPIHAAAASGRVTMGLVLIALGELAGRYLFYVTVVPHSTAQGFFPRP